MPGGRVDSCWSWYAPTATSFPFRSVSVSLPIASTYLLAMIVFLHTHPLSTISVPFEVLTRKCLLSAHRGV
ncbi:hypothetical protein BDN72DRAFT_836625 [Pluteus cervinus]|uniref:Uncharacterized protein n=1 Tax=Pluteus cervinus TaxID=181527 RepID=A0ACD3B2L4_9AGAR|nr:hypothetical protein BDN72DRAFT_836625 [Pluteus cervinus]